jgi:membrane-bound inhibitor of C-type lysozyme
MKIIWNKVTKFSQIVAIVLFVIVFFTGILIGKKSTTTSILGKPIANALFTCADNKKIESTFYKNFVHIETKSLGTLYLPQTISASGARYANNDESIVFWNKGDTAFVTESDQNNPTYKDCVSTSK